MALVAAAGGRLGRLHPGRLRVGLGDPALGQSQVGTPFGRAAGHGAGRPGLPLDPLGRGRLAARLCCLTATFFFNDLTMGPAWASCADIGERYAGTLSGAMNMIRALAGAAGAALAGSLFHRGRPELVFVIFAGVYMLAALCWLKVDVTKRLADSE